MPRNRGVPDFQFLNPQIFLKKNGFTGMRWNDFLIEKWGNRKPEIGSREYCPKNNYRKNQKTSSNKKGIHFSISRNTILKRNLKIISLKIISQKNNTKKKSIIKKFLICKSCKRKIFLKKTYQKFLYHKSPNLKCLKKQSPKKKHHRK